MTHNLGTSDIIVMLRNASGEYQMTDYTANGTSQVTVTCNPATSEALTAVIIG